MLEGHRKYLLVVEDLGGMNILSHGMKVTHLINCGWSCVGWTNGTVTVVAGSKSVSNHRFHGRDPIVLPPCILKVMQFVLGVENCERNWDTELVLNKYGLYYLLIAIL